MIAIKKDWGLARRELLKSLGVGAACLPILSATKSYAQGNAFPKRAMIILLTEGYRPGPWIEKTPELRRAIDAIGGELDGGSGLFRPIVDALTGEDRYLVCADFADYAAAQRRAAAAYALAGEWWRRSILNVAGMGKFSSDRTTRQYAEEIWGVRPVPVEEP